MLPGKNNYAVLLARAEALRLDRSVANEITRLSLRQRTLGEPQCPD